MQCLSKSLDTADIKHWVSSRLQDSVCLWQNYRCWTLRSSRHHSSEVVYFQRRCESLTSLNINIVLSVYHVRFEVSLRWYVTQCTAVPAHLTPWNRFLLDDITLLQPVKILPAFYGARRSLPPSQEPASFPYGEQD